VRAIGARESRGLLLKKQKNPKKIGFFQKIPLREVLLVTLRHAV